MPTTPTSYYNRLTGGETWTDAVNFGSVAHIFGGAVSFTGTPTFSNAVVLPVGTQVAGPGLVDVASATTTLALSAATHAGKVVTFHSTGGLAVTPPAATGTGNIYQFIATATITGGSFTIDAKAGNASDVFGGTCVAGSSGGTSATFGTASNSNLLTCGGSTTGGLKGTWIEMIDVATNVWAIFISNVCSGSAATPFSNH